ncbi:MAG: M28 family peptidase [Candidatus Rokubacteria bacterium]|nr:M28 family peptidase [Candidatus Rokubacteria bacterium]
MTTVRDFGFYLRGRINSGLSWLLNARRPASLPPPAPLPSVLRDGGSPLALSRLLEGRANDARQAAVAWYLEQRGVPFARHAFAGFEGRGENFSVDVGAGDRVLLLIAHHDAVPGSPGANDNAAAVGVLLHLLGRLPALVPAGLRVRLLFTAAEERGYLGARAYVRDGPVSDLVGVLSLELCGVGDSVAIWDAEPESPFLARVTGALEGLGLRRDERSHVVGRIPVFGSDHRAFAAAGVPAYGFTIVPTRHADALRQFVFSPLRSTLRFLVRRPPPFDTYHTPRDSGATLEPAALNLAVRALEAIVTAAGRA